jgi:hypothetical protein
MRCVQILQQLFRSSEFLVVEFRFRLLWFFWFFVIVVEKLGASSFPLYTDRRDPFCFGTINRSLCAIAKKPGSITCCRIWNREQ